MSTAKPTHLATLEDLLAVPEERRPELIGGEIVEKVTGFDHGVAQFALSGLLYGFGGPKGGGRGPGGWWIGTEIDVAYEAHELYRHDLAGWRREHLPERPTQRPVRIKPDWACEILSPSNMSNDTVTKQRVLHRHAVPHYWLVDPIGGVVRVMRWSADGYIDVASAHAGEMLRAEPFDEIEMSVDEILGRG